MNTASADDRNNMGFPVIPFVIIWPLIRLVAVPLIKAVLPYLLRRIAENLESGQPGVISESELLEAIEGQKSQMQAVYKGS